MDAVAANPNDVVARERLAVHFAGLAQLQSPLPRNTLGLLPGFMRRPDMDALQDCFLAERAIRELSALIDNGPEIHAALRAAGLDVADLIGLRGVLYEGFWQTALGAEQCDLAAAHVPYERENSADRANALRHKAAMLRAEIAMRPALSQVQVAELHKAAERIAPHVAKLAKFAPYRWRHFTELPDDLVLCASFHTRLAEIEAVPQLRCIGWMENLDYTEDYGHRNVVGCFVDDHGSLVQLSGSHKMHVLDADTLLTDGSLVSVTAGRGRNPFDHGQHIDRLLVDPMPLADLLAIHQSFVRLCVSRRPGTAVQAPHTITDAVALLEQGRVLHTAHRLEYGLSDTEVRATGFTDPDVAMLVAQSAVRNLVADAQARAAQAAHDAAAAAPMSASAA